MAESQEKLPSRTIELWFDFASNYSYLSIFRLEPLAQQAGVDVLWKPFLLGPIFKSFGWDSSPFVLQKQKGDHMWKDMDRQARKYAVPWTKPSVFPRTAVLPLRVAVLAADQPWMGEFCRRVMLKNFADDSDINTPDIIAGLLADLGLDSATILRDALTDANKLRLRQQTDEAARRGVFGAPTFFVGDEMFWGNDRLEDALALAAG